jgi:hypothetical protein
MSSHYPDSTPSGPAPSIPPAATPAVEYVVRPCYDVSNEAGDDAWLIEHAGGSYGPYKNCREAMFFAIDAARKLGAQGKSTRVKAIDHAGHLLTTWNYGVDGNPRPF